MTKNTLLATLINPIKKNPQCNDEYCVTNNSINIIDKVIFMLSAQIKLIAPITCLERN